MFIWILTGILHIIFFPPPSIPFNKHERLHDRERGREGQYSLLTTTEIVPTSLAPGRGEGGKGRGRPGQSYL